MATRLPRLRDRRDDRPRQILDEAIRIIGQRGYYGFSIKELAESCGLTVAGVLHHFGTKVGLLVALLRDREEKDSQAIIANVRDDSDPAPDLDSHSFGQTGPDAALPLIRTKADVRKILHAVALRDVEQPEMVRLYAMLRTEAVYADHPAFAYFSDRNARAYCALTELVRGHVPDPAASAVQLLASLSGMQDLWLRDLEGFDLVGHWDCAVAKILD